MNGREIIDGLRELRDAVRDRAPLRSLFGVRTARKPASCVQCGRPVEEARECYAAPICHACLPPPKPLPKRMD